MKTYHPDHDKKKRSQDSGTVAWHPNTQRCRNAVRHILTATTTTHSQNKSTQAPVHDTLEHQADQAADTVVKDHSSWPIVAASSAATQPPPTSSSPDAPGAGQPLPNDVRGFMEPRFGERFDHVRIHHNDQAHHMAERQQARAFTTGHHVVFGKGEYQPNTLTGKHLIAHELSHVIQQRHGKPTLQRKPTAPIPFDPPYEANINYTEGLKYYKQHGQQTPKWQQSPSDLKSDAEVIPDNTSLKITHRNHQGGWLFAETADGKRKGWVIQVFVVKPKPKPVEEKAPEPPLNDALEKAPATTKPSGFNPFQGMDISKLVDLENQLYGLEDAYKTYRDPALLGTSASPFAYPINVPAREKEINKKLTPFKMSSKQFDALITSYKSEYQDVALKVAFNTLNHYDQQLSKYKTDFEGNAAGHLSSSPYMQSARRHDAEVDKLRQQKKVGQPITGIQTGTLDPQEVEKIDTEISERNDSIQTNVRLMNLHYPLTLREDFDWRALANSRNEEGVRKVILADIQKRHDAVIKAKNLLTEKKSRIFAMDAIVNEMAATLNVEPKSIIASIINDAKDEAKMPEKALTYVLTVLSIALSFVPGGGIIGLAANATITGLTIYDVIREYEEYEDQQTAKTAGLSTQDPSALWLIISIIDAGLDIHTTIKTIKGLGLVKPLEAFNKSKSLTDLHELQKNLDKLHQLDTKIDQAIRRGAELEALSNKALGKAVGNLSINAGTDFQSIVQFAYYGVNRGITRFKEFLLELERFHLIKNTQLPPEELAQFKRAFEEGKSLNKKGLKPRKSPKQGTEAVGIDPRARGYAVEDFHIDLLKAREGGWNGLPDYFPGLDAYKGGGKPKFVNGWYEYRPKQAVSIKSTSITTVQGVEEKIAQDLSAINKGTFAQASSKTKVFTSGSDKKLHLVFEQGFAGAVTDNKALIKLLEDARKAKTHGIEFEWFVTVMGDIIPGPKYLKRMKLVEY